MNNTYGEQPPKPLPPESFAEWEAEQQQPSIPKNKPPDDIPPETATLRNDGPKPVKPASFAEWAAEERQVELAKVRAWAEAEHKKRLERVLNNLEFTQHSGARQALRDAGYNPDSFSCPWAVEHDEQTGKFRIVKDSDGFIKGAAHAAKQKKLRQVEVGRVFRSYQVAWDYLSRRAIRLDAPDNLYHIRHSGALFIIELRSCSPAAGVPSHKAVEVGRVFRRYPSAMLYLHRRGMKLSSPDCPYRIVRSGDNLFSIQLKQQPSSAEDFSI